MKTRKLQGVKFGQAGQLNTAESTQPWRMQVSVTKKTEDSLNAALRFHPFCSERYSVGLRPVTVLKILEK